MKQEKDPQEEFEFNDDTFSSLTDRTVKISRTREKYNGFKLNREQLKKIILWEGNRIKEEDLEFALEEFKKGIYLDDKLDFLKKIHIPKLKKEYRKNENDFASRFESALNNVIYHIPRTIEILDCYSKNGIVERGSSDELLFELDITNFMEKIGKNWKIDTYDCRSLKGYKKNNYKIVFTNYLSCYRYTLFTVSTDISIIVSKNGFLKNLELYERETPRDKATIRKFQKVDEFSEQMKDYHLKSPERAEVIYEELNNYSTFLDSIVDNLKYKLGKEYNLEGKVAFN